MHKLKVAIVGCGKMAENHIGKIKSLVDNDMIAVCDSNEIKTEYFFDRFDVTRHYRSVDELLEQFQPDIVHIVTPPGSHKAVAVQCLRGGADVYIEKPICRTLDEFDEIARVAETEGRHFCVGHQRIFETLYAKFKALIAKRDFGALLRMRAYDSAPFYSMVAADSRRAAAQLNPEGMFYDLLPHMLGLFDDQVHDLDCRFTRFLNDEQGHTLESESVFVSATSGVSATAVSSFKPDFVQNFIEFDFEKGTIRMDLRNNLITVLGQSFLPGMIDRFMLPFRHSFKLFAGNFVNIFRYAVGWADPYEGVGALAERLYLSHGKAQTPMPIERMRRVVDLTAQAIDRADTAERSELAMASSGGA